MKRLETWIPLVGCKEKQGNSTGKEVSGPKKGLRKLPTPALSGSGSRVSSQPRYCGAPLFLLTRLKHFHACIANGNWRQWTGIRRNTANAEVQQEGANEGWICHPRWIWLVKYGRPVPRPNGGAGSGGGSRHWPQWQCASRQRSPELSCGITFWDAPAPSAYEIPVNSIAVESINSGGDGAAGKAVCACGLAQSYSVIAVTSRFAGTRSRLRVTLRYPEGRYATISCR